MRRDTSTIQDRIDGGYNLTVYCHNPDCHHRAELDWLALRDKLGPDHGAMHDDIVPLLRCTKCNGERGKQIGIRVAPKDVPGASYRQAKEGR